MASSCSEAGLKVKQVIMSWTAVHDVILCREIIFQNPYSEKKKSVQRSAIWDKIADKLNECDHLKFAVDKRSVRDHIAILIKRQKRKLAAEEKSTGTNPEPTELDDLLEQIIELEETADIQLAQLNEEKKEQAVDEKVKANDIRQKAMEKLGETMRRKSEEPGDKKVKRQRRNGSDTIQFLKEKAEQDLHFKQEEMKLKQSEQTLQEKRLEAISKQQMENQTQQRAMLGAFESQQRLQQEQQKQMINMQMMMMNQQQEQTRAMMLLMDRLANK